MRQCEDGLTSKLGVRKMLFEQMFSNLFHRSSHRPAISRLLRTDVPTIDHVEISPTYFSQRRPLLTSRDRGGFLDFNSGVAGVS